MNFKRFFESSDFDDYRGSHRAPGKSDSTAPLWDLSKIYPDDIYSSNAARYYGDASNLDNLAIYVMHSYRNKPNKTLLVYRAVPNLNVEVDKNIKELNTKLRDATKMFPKINWNEFNELGFKDYNELPKYVDYLVNKKEDLEKVKSSKKLSINPGDWITTVKEYAKQHGESTLNGNYKIITKKVFARDLFTDANSIFEFGYDPQPKVES